MTPSPFVHLRTHSQLSFVDSLLLTAKDKDRPGNLSLPQLAANDRQEALALTDLHGMFGTITFYRQARALGVKPLIGIDAWVDPDVTQGEDAEPVRMVLLCQDYTGYRRMMELLSRSHTENHRDEKPRLKQSWFQEGTQGLLALSGDGTNGELAQLFVEGMGSEAREAADRMAAFYAQVFPGRYHLEVQRYAQPNETIQVEETVALSQRHNLPVVATHPVLFAKREDYYAHEVRTCVANKEVVGDLVRTTPYTREQYFKTATEMAELFADLPEALANTVALSHRCSAEIPLDIPSLPRFPTPNGQSESDYFAHLARAGLERRLDNDFPDPQRREAIRAEYAARLEYEIGVINKMGFPGYFLIVADFISWAKDSGIPIGPGRGSGAGSLVAYSLRITNLDPIPNGLIFERFLNPDRVSMPDFDIDMDIFRRGEIIDYVRNKYGASAVAQISTTGTSAAKASVRNVVRALGLPFKVGDVIAKLVPAELDITLDRALEKEPKLREKYEQEPIVRTVIDLARKLEGMATSVGKHAAGVLISPGQITDFTPLHLGKEGVVSQYDKDDVEHAGLVKFDFLGLATLSIVREAVDFINRRVDFQERPFDIDAISLDDAKVYRSFAQGNTVGVFQFESGGMQAVLRQARPDRFADIVALNALYRPGPMDLIPLYLDRKLGRKEVEYPDPRVKDVLEETYGIMVYQEQVMKVAQLLGGYSLSGADSLRKAMGKKLPHEMETHRKLFCEGAGSNGIPLQQAEDLFGLIETFVGYGFNKSHAAAYSLVAYQTAYLKTHFPAEFYAASMNVAARQSKQAEIEKLMGDARAQGLKILPPDINEGSALFEPVGGASLRYGLAGLKSISEGPIGAIVRAREEQGRFVSLFDFFAKVGRGVASKTVAESLIRSGAFDGLHDNRAALIASVKSGVDYAGKLAKKEVEKGDLLPVDLFGEAAPPKKKKKSTEVIEPMLAEAVPWSPREQLEQEKKAVGFYFSAHPFEIYAKHLQGLPGAVPLSRVDDVDPEAGGTYLVAGVIAEVRKITTANGKQMARVRINDGQDGRDLTVFPVAYESHSALLQPGAFLAAEVKVEYDRRGKDQPKGLLMEDAWSFEGYEAHQARSLHIALPRHDLPKLAALAQKHATSGPRGPLEIKTVAYVPEDETNYHKIELNTLRLTNEPGLLAELKEVFGAAKVKMGFARTMQFRPKAPRFGPSRRRGP